MASGDDRIPVTVYYESLCPDSIAFVTNQLAPAQSTRLKNYMDVQLVPYGKASHSRSEENNQKWEFKCHHGPVECYGNKVHGCILKQIPEENDQFKYIDCLMKQAKVMRNQYPLSPCIEGADLTTVTSCANGTYPNAMGANLLAANGDETAKLNPPLTSVPTIVFNRTYNKTESDMAQKNFRKVLCSYLEGECPVECYISSSSTKLFLPSTAAILFFIILRFF
ncbi:gamma-interferon-inducible lysosomal thiol reductase precursor, putative [Pediculus humanus corporis]|uniref:Gamma-interferon-inducible lysosomal thiol reductase, putative n=1 Tax=Pediculus humanus subsp. corporis TaxID=121224 RepID=E0W468_PEDHC|nr:gamma-interferon-inducible lysosomal thiol reductase precursor, putative [Pediculus humanus corporis]EEB20424.1 gamma-interferon-inducible lysosomal thiol reductase precursor, putative [Pediculus humanus corporis]